MEGGPTDLPAPVDDNMTIRRQSSREL